jgi:monothiol glutaredoxin
MDRLVLSADCIHPAIQTDIETRFRDTLNEVTAAVKSNDIVVVGMAQNPHCKRARKYLDNANKTYAYLEYGSYFKEWPRRLTLKMWSGWRTFPMVFVKGTLIGGASDLQKLIDSKELNKLLGK